MKRRRFPYLDNAIFQPSKTKNRLKFILILSSEYKILFQNILGGCSDEISICSDLISQCGLKGVRSRCAKTCGYCKVEAFNGIHLNLNKCADEPWCDKQGITFGMCSNSPKDLYKKLCPLTCRTCEENMPEIHTDIYQCVDQVQT